jgi:hypothetical protein
MSNQGQATYFTIRQFCEKHKFLTEASLRNIIFHARPRKNSAGLIPGNGLDGALVRMGRKILIDEKKFFEWLLSQQKS